MHDEADSAWLLTTILSAAEGAGIEMAVSPKASVDEGDSLHVDVGAAVLDAGAFLGGHSGYAALESLRKSEERFRSVVESIHDAVFMTEGTLITYANLACSKLLGITPTPTAPFSISTTTTCR